MKFVTNFIVVLYSIFNIQQPSPRMTIKVFIVYIAGSGAFGPKGPSELIYRAPGTTKFLWNSSRICFKCLFVGP